jgi:anti-sigma factor RsiW
MNLTMKTTDCKTCHTHLSDLLLDDAYASGHPEIAAHLEGCAACHAELAELRATFALLSDWTAPEPPPYFDSRLRARVREAEAARPEGLLERARYFFLFSTGRHLRPVMAGALGLVLLVGGGTTVYERTTMVNTAASPTVNDLRIFDKNAQALEQMDQLLDDGSSNADVPAVPPRT